MKSLKISRVDYISQEVDIHQLTHVQISLVAVYSNLNEVVTIGYGTAKKKDLTGAIGSVTEKDFNQGNFILPRFINSGESFRGANHIG